MKPLQHLERNPHNRRVLLWQPVSAYTISQLDEMLYELDHVLQSEIEPVQLVFQPLADLPRGNVLPCVNRLFRLLSDHDHFQRLIVVLTDSHPVAQQFMRFFPAMYGQVGKFQVVCSREEAATILRRNARA